MLARALFLSVVLCSGVTLAQVHLPTAGPMATRTAAPVATTPTTSSGAAPAPLSALPAIPLGNASTPQPVILTYPAPARLPAYGGPLDESTYSPVVAWMRAEALLWWIQGRSLPPLLSQSPAGTPLDQAGVLGSPGTQTVFGGGDATGGLRLGGRYSLGIWIDDGCKSFGLEGSFFHLPSFSDNATVGGEGITGRPFVNALTGQPDAQLVSFPGVLAGTATADLRSNVMGADASLRCPLSCQTSCTGPRYDLLVGYRWLRYEEQLTIRENLFPQGEVFVPGTNIQVVDQFRVRNQFHGVLLGLAGTWRLDRFTLEAIGRVSVGHL
ncbi:MAG: BBP7 family outer membrane beta-barrel protein, partial [Gemmataceae bacterium]